MFTMYEEGFDIVIHSTCIVTETIHNGRGHRNTIVEYTHIESASIEPICVKEEPITKVSKPKHKEPNMYHDVSNDYGPQRYDEDGVPLEMSCDSGLWINQDGNILADETYNPLRDDFGVNVPNGKMDVFGEVLYFNEEYQEDKLTRFNLEYYMKYNPLKLENKRKDTLDIEKLKQAKLKDRKLARWIWYNKDVIENIYQDIDNKWREQVPCVFNEDVNASKEYNSSNITDIGISWEPSTHLSKEQLKFWSGILWYVIHDTKGGLKETRKAYNSDIITNEEYRYISGMCNYGMKSIWIKEEDKKLPERVVSKGKWGWIISVFSNVRKQRKGKEWTYEQILAGYPKFYKPSRKEVSKDTYRVIHFYEPIVSSFEGLPEGLLLSIDWRKDKGFFNKHQMTLLGKERAIRHYQEYVAESTKDHVVSYKNVTKKWREGTPIFKNQWNSWLEDHVSYLHDTRIMTYK